VIGSTVSHYKIVERLGRGGMGVVYKARDFKLDRFVALKFLPSDLSGDEEVKKRFIYEAKAASALDHPNICVIHEIDETNDGRMFISMSYYDGEPLNKQVTGDPLSIDRTVDLAAQIAQGLAKAHEHGITHRDIKPANVLVTRDGVAKIVDFGLAKLAGKTRLTKTGTLMGTAAYMSPEQVQGRDVDERSDIWAYGVLLYEMLTGQLPFRGDNEIALIYSILNEDPDPVVQYRPDVPEALTHVIDRALEKDPAARYQSTVEVLADLRGMQSPESTPPARPAAALATNLPGELTSFIGREHQIGQVKDLLSASRLVTLTGPGGTGKTRLSLRIAADISDEFDHGVYFVGLASINDPDLGLPTIARNLGVREIGGETILESLKRHLRGRRMLLLLDNFKHVMKAATCITELMAASPGLAALVTSREPLHLSGESQFPVPPLGLPDPGRLPPVESLAEYDAVALFVQRALAVKPDFALTEESAPAVVELCLRLDGLPLAIELAAARIRVLSPQAMLARLAHRLTLLTGGPRDVPARQQTLRGTIQWSHDLLDEGEKKLFRRLSVFAGGCSFEAVETVCNVTHDLEMGILGGMDSLVDKNLVRQRNLPDGEPRFPMLETIREFGREMLTAGGEDGLLRSAHRDFFLRLAEEAEPYLTGPDQGKWLERLETEHDNLRMAMEWTKADETGLEAELRLAGSLWRFWLVRGHLSEGRKWLAEAAARKGAASHPRMLAKVLSGAGTLAHNQGDYSGSASHFQQNLNLHRELNDKPGIAFALNNLGWTHWRRCEYVSARSFSEESLKLHREISDSRGIASSLSNLGWVALFQGDYSVARSHFERTLAIRRELEDKRGIAFSLSMLGWVESEQGAHDRASSLIEQASTLFQELGDKQLTAFTLSLWGCVAYEQGDDERAASLIRERSLPLFREIGDRWGIAFALHWLGRVTLRRRHPDRAATLMEESLAIRRETSDKWGVAQSLWGLGKTACLRGDLDRGAELLRESLALRREMGDRAGIVACLEGLGTVSCRFRQFDRAAKLFGSAEAQREGLGAPLPPSGRAEHELQVATVRKELGEEAFAARWVEGKGITLEDVIEYASSS
jgi:predicted ATPase/tRNA A-37 threonylcarbamoyl transferase component Bud32